MTTIEKLQRVTVELQHAGYAVAVTGASNSPLVSCEVKWPSEISVDFELPLRCVDLLVEALDDVVVRFLTDEELDAREAAAKEAGQGSTP